MKVVAETMSARRVCSQLERHMAKRLRSMDTDEVLTAARWIPEIGLNSSITAKLAVPLRRRMEDLEMLQPEDFVALAPLYYNYPPYKDNFRNAVNELELTDKIEVLRMYAENAKSMPDIDLRSICNSILLHEEELKPEEVGKLAPIMSQSHSFIILSRALNQHHQSMCARSLSDTVYQLLKNDHSIKEEVCFHIKELLGSNLAQCSKFVKNLWQLDSKSMNQKSDAGSQIDELQHCLIDRVVDHMHECLQVYQAKRRDPFVGDLITILEFFSTRKLTHPDFVELSSKLIHRNIPYLTDSEVSRCFKALKCLQV